MRPDDGDNIASALAVFAMGLLGLSLLVAGLILGRKMGQLFRGQRLDARQSAHGHEDRRVNDAVRRRELAETRSTVGLEKSKLSPQSSVLSPAIAASSSRAGRSPADSA